MSEPSLQALIDEAEIHRLLTRYAEALDTRDYAALDEVFTENATSNYEGIGKFDGREAIRGLMRRALEQCGPTQHLLGTVRIELIDDSHARARCYLAAIHVGKGEYEGKLYTVWGEYRDRLEKVTAGWRIVHRELAGIHAEGDIGMDLS